MYRNKKKNDILKANFQMFHYCLLVYSYQVEYFVSFVIPFSLSSINLGSATLFLNLHLLQCFITTHSPTSHPLFFYHYLNLIYFFLLIFKNHNEYHVLFEYKTHLMHSIKCIVIILVSLVKK